MRAITQALIARGLQLIEIDDKYRFLKHGIAIVDLGAAPGGWSRSRQRVGAVNGKGKVVAIDTSRMPKSPASISRS